MTILIEQPELSTMAEAHQERIDEQMRNELVLDGGFPLPKPLSEDGFKAPQINSYGRSFRNYHGESARQKSVEEFYKLQHTNQTYEFAKKMRAEYGKLNKAEMGIWECCELLEGIVDASDPDLEESQIQHAFQSAEAARKDYPNEDWLHLTALIHGIILSTYFNELFTNTKKMIFIIAGDSFPLGCAFDEANTHHKYFKNNPDNNNPAYNTKNGIYTEGCGLDNVIMSWGHDEYMYLVSDESNKLNMHEFTALFQTGAYKHLYREEDVENLKWLHIFHKYDLYSKSNVLIDVEKVKPYYLSLIEKYFPSKLKW
ncbi:inositol oxygenase 2-like [Arachis ipaensis]|uniref:inositol oxygenase 2-like n=1 Tax=Arachis ipaensis TaxID=130454 RepID=UPI000A2B2721|nr:inositol oxygenase 2-like [Arachis ipaensis]